MNKKLSVHKEVWDTWAKAANKVEQSRSKTKDLINFVENKSYLVFYTKDCTPHINTFKSLKTAKKFCDKFKVDETDNWIDFIIAGEIIVDYDITRGIIRNQK